MRCIINRLGGILFGLVAACTGQIETDQPGDDDPMEPGGTEVRVVIKDGSVPAAGVRVVFQNADDSVVADLVTDATGSVATEMTAGNVSVMRIYAPVSPPPEGGQRVPEIYTYVGVKAGDVLELANPEPLTPATPGAIVVQVPPTDGTIEVTTPCGSGAGEAPNVAITVSGCSAMLDLFVEANGSSFYVQKPFANSVDVSMGVLNESLAATISATNVPADSSVEVDQRLYAGPFMLYSAGNRRVDQAPQTVELPSVTGVDQLLVVRVATNGRGSQMIGDRSRYSGSPVTVDGSAHLIPYVTGPIDYSPTGVSWGEVGPGTVDAVLLTMAVTRGGAMGPPGINAEYMRYVIAPHGGLQMRLPTVPDFQYNPTTADQMAGALGLVKSTAGYDGLRGKAFATADLVESAPVDGAITLSYSGQAPGR